ncbi:MAG: magnesium chelatase, partial [Muribaculaceae bacterium]|nr:magnesium chelatase [Muribaculaceae bacterium]
MLVKTYGAAVQGIDALTVTIEVLVNPGFTFSIVGLPDTAVKESQERVMSAIGMSGHTVPHRLILVNMSPADIRKEGAAYDLPIATAILAADGQINPDRLS